MRFLSKLISDKRGMVNKMIGLIVIVILFGSLIGLVFQTIASVDTSGWNNPAAAALWSVFPVLVGIGLIVPLIMYVIPKVKGL